MDYKVNTFWSGIINQPKIISPRQIEASTLARAAEIALSSKEENVLFKRNREIIDLNGRFRYFFFNGEAYILKETKQNQGAEELKKAKQSYQRINRHRLSNGWSIEVVVPLLFTFSNQREVLLSKDYGKTLHQDLLERSTHFSESFFFELLEHLLKHGIYWIGFVPRNIFLDKAKKKIRLIDWEETHFSEINQIPLIDELFLLKMYLNWSYLFKSKSLINKINFYFKKDEKNKCFRALDHFELTYKSIIPSSMSDKKVRQICADATLQSEKYLKFQNTKMEITPFELGHLIDDFLPNRLSVFFTFATAKSRIDYDPRVYADFLQAIMRGCQLVISLSNNEPKNCFHSVTKIVLLCVVSLFELNNQLLWKSLKQTESYTHFIKVLTYHSIFCQTLTQYENLKNKKGLEAAYQRSVFVEHLLDKIYTIIMYIFDIKEDVHLMIRGSLAQRMMTCLSDVDFELSGPKFPIGCEGLELLISDFFTVFDISCEISHNRPLEKDLLSPQGLSRDLHEWMQLRRPLSIEHNPTWCQQIFPFIQEMDWTKTSIYEKNYNELNAKFLFFSIRDVIARYSFYHRKYISTTYEQLQIMESSLPFNIIKEIQRLLLQSLFIYENNINDNQLLRSLEKNIRCIRRKIFSNPSGKKTIPS